MRPPPPGAPREIVLRLEPMKLRSFRENACQRPKFFRPAARRLRIQGGENLGDDSFQEGRFKSSAVTIAPAAKKKSDGDVLDAGRKWLSERMVDPQFYFALESVREAKGLHRKERRSYDSKFTKIPQVPGNAETRRASGAAIPKDQL